MSTTELQLREFYAIPPAVKAIQWDGSEEVAQLIFKAIKLHTGRVSVRLIVFIDEKRASGRLEIKYGIDGQEHLIEGDWVILHPENGRVEFLPHTSFMRNYEPKED